MTRMSRPVRAGCAVLLALLGLACAGAPVPAAAQVTTVQLLQDTVNALPSCLRWRPTGACVWLRCSALPPNCRLVTTLRMEHYVPEAFVTTWHDAAQHPWEDFGRIVARSVSGVGRSVLSAALDSAGSSTPTREHLVFRDADAIANPVSMLADLAAGGSVPELPNMIAVPGPQEMAAFPGQMGAIARSWGSVPATVAAGVKAQAQDLANLPQQLASLPGRFAAATGRLGNLLPGSVPFDLPGGGGGGAGPGGGHGGGPGAGETPTLGSQVDLGPLQRVARAVQAMAGSGSAFFCPGVASPFGVYFHSLLDGWTWRGLLPAEMLYPQSWLPGMAEVGQFPANTWGSVYPREGSLTQTHPVKASAVIAQRVASILTQRGQPHVYQFLARSGGSFRYFDPGTDVLWQRLHPQAESRCSAFGANDSLSLASWGDGRTTAPEGYIWNLWRRTECCQRRGIFISTVTW
jgi:hypothetical protein